MTGLALALLLAAAPAPAAELPGTLVYAIGEDLDSLDPHWAYDAASLFVTDQVYDTLIDFSGASLDAYEPSIATVVPTRENGFLSRDGLTYAFPLRRGVKFHDGAPLTPEDVRYSILRFLLLDRDGGPSALLLEPLLGIKSTKELPPAEVWKRADAAVRLEGGALMIRPRRPFQPLLSILAGYAPIVSRAFVAAEGGWDGRPETWVRARNPAKQASALYDRANGTGPFKLVGWNHREAVLERHAGYWRSPASLARVAIKVVPDSRVRRRMLEAGEADIAWVERRYLAQFEGLPGVEITDGLPLLEAQNVIFLNQKVAAGDNHWLGSGRLDGQGLPPTLLANEDLRRGLALAFDWERFIAEAYHGKAVRAKGPVPRGLAGRHDRMPQFTFNLDNAAESFRKAQGGEVWAKGFLLPVAYAEGLADSGLACKILKEGAEKVNPLFRIDCRPVSQSRLLDEMRRKRLPAFVYRWVLDYPDPHNAIEPFLHSKGYFAEVLGYRSPRADKMIDDAVGEPDAARRKALYHDLQALASIEVPMIFTADAYHAVVRRAKVQGFVYNAITPYGRLYEVSKTP